MWTRVDEEIRRRIKDNIINEARTKLIVYLVLIFLLEVVLFLSFRTNEAEGILSLAMLVFISLFIFVGILGVFYSYYVTIDELTLLVDNASYMCVGSVVTKLSNSSDFKVMVKIPEDNITMNIITERAFYKEAIPGKRILILAASKKLESTMYGVTPAAYDDDGIL